MYALSPIEVKAKKGNEPFKLNSRKLPFTLLDFWSWSQSDLLNNTLRGTLAEFIVKMDMGIKNDVRTEWDAYDLETDEGVKIEMKSAAFLQSWHQKKLSKISFNIAPTNGWNAKTNE